MKAVRIIGHTLVAFNNCFSVEGEDGKRYGIVNFYEEAISNLPVEWPVEIKVLEGRVAVIHDDRIPNRFYRKRFCEVCCPEHLLPIIQKLERERQESRGERVPHKTGTSVMIVCGKAPKMELIDESKHKDGCYYAYPIRV